MLGFDVGTIIALAAMLVSLFGAGIKFIDRKKQLNKEETQLNRKRAIADVERDSIVVRGAEGALLLMERTLKTTSDECEKRINELEDEVTDLKCENSSLRQEVKELRAEIQGFNERLRRIE